MKVFAMSVFSHSRVAARLEKPPALDLRVKEATSEGGEVEEEEEGAWGAKRETPSRRGEY